ncbi:MAG TPA: porin, partial [Xanthobacteraceae bacterium]|nr:porin [Xanthobacteraceae bacterium]
QYVKVCSLYGAGFYYMPGTDMCIKIGGWTRAEITGGNLNGNMTWGPFNGAANNRTTSNVAMRARGYITADAREQTAYGVARAYIAVGLSTSDVGLNNAANQFSANRAFVQWAGFTAGLAVSFYDFYSVPAAQYRGGYLPASDTGDGGWWVWGYTAQLGGGFSATIAAEERRTTQIIDGTCASFGGGAFGTGAAPTFASTPTCGSYATGAYPTAITAGGFPLAAGSGLSPGFGSYGGLQVPDIVGNLRVDQAWGSAQVMAAYHDVNASYYSATSSSAPSVGNLAHPSDAAGWAVGAGLKVNFPMIAAGDYFQTQVNYSQGAMRYLFNTPNTNWGFASGAGTLGNTAYGVLSDCVFGGTAAAGVTTNATGCQLTTGWGFNASYEHYWTPQWHQSLYGAYYAVNYDSAANNMLCSAAGFGNGTTTVGASSLANAGCNNNWNMWGIGSRLQWDVTKSFYVGVEALYERLDSASSGASSVGGFTSGANGASLSTSSASAWTFTLRMHKDFLP